MGAGGYRDLEVWQLGMELATDAYRLTRSFPTDELYGLTSQIRRSAASVPANIAEGYGRNSQKSLAYFLRISIGSLKELETHVILAQRLGYIDDRQLGAIVSRSDELSAKL